MTHRSSISTHISHPPSTLSIQNNSSFLHLNPFNSLSLSSFFSLFSLILSLSHQGFLLYLPPPVFLLFLIFCPELPLFPQHLSTYHSSLSFINLSISFCPPPQLDPSFHPVVSMLLFLPSQISSLSPTSFYRMMYHLRCVIIHPSFPLSSFAVLLNLL